MAFTPQTSVTDRETEIQGQFNPFDQITTDTRTADGATAIDPGMAVIKSTLDTDVILPAAAFTEIAFQGVVGLSLVDKEQNILTGDKSFVANDVLTIVTDGKIFVLVDDTVAKDTPCYFVHTAGGASAIHTFRSDADTARASTIPAVYLTDGVADDLVQIRVSEGARISTVLP